MTLEELQARKAYLEATITQNTNQVLVLHGQKGEVEHHIQLELDKIAKAEAENIATTDVLPVE